ncbi:MAG: lipid-A-disaccharide synthase [Ignavibacteria bacterium]|nr:lipid-A-disaccharide synthase [Ignavibacteria bacterium]
MNQGPGIAVKKRVFISAGELSGDMHGASLISEIQKKLHGTTVHFSGLGGNLMAEQGFKSLYDIKELATVGFVDVIKKYGFFKKVIADCVKFVKDTNPDVVVLIDYPGFNIRLAEELKEFYKNRIIYYISPQLWAWHERRVNKIRKFTDKMLVVFPFEVDFYKKHSVDAVYVGHPLVKKIRNFLDTAPPAVKKVSDEKIITILPGSREGEIRQHMPVIIEVLKLVKKQFKLRVNISAAPGNLAVINEFSESIGEYNVVTGSMYNYIQNSDLVLTKAGTSTMECALIGTPHLIFYKTSPFNYYLLKPIVKVNKLGIVNIISGKDVIKEFVQNDFTPENVYNEAVKIIADPEYRNGMKKDLSKVWEILGNTDASAVAAQMIIEEAQL